jgi:prophage tail gpP-like protein
MANETAITIEGKRFRYWERVRIELVFDGIDTVEFDAPFEPDSKDFRDTFKPFSFKEMALTVDDDELFTGTIVPITPSVTPDQQMVNVGAYALPGVMEDCTQSAAGLPFEYRKQDLQQIVETVAEPFGLDVEFEIDPGAAFDKVRARPTEKILPWIVGLAQQRGGIISNNSAGALTCIEELSFGVPIAILEEGLSPLISITPTFSPQQFYSDVTGLKPVKIRSKKSIQYTSKNLLLENVIRPYIFEVRDVKDADLQKAVESKIGHMFGAMVSYNVEVCTWRDNLDALWSPNTLIKITAPSAMIYEPYTFFIRSVTFTKDAENERAVLNCVLSGSFRGEIPEALPWD